VLDATAATVAEDQCAATLREGGRGLAAREGGGYRGGEQAVREGGLNLAAFGGGGSERRDAEGGSTVAARVRPAPVAWEVNRNALYIDKIAISIPRYRSTQLRMYISISLYLRSGVTRRTAPWSRRARGQRPWRGR